jgi:hypothetical protein
MSDFVTRCREEWRRLGVPDALADEMATDLTSDLSEADADGVSAEDFLGASYHDPPAFAASWAAGRGVIPDPPRRGRTRRRPLALVAFTAFAALTFVVAALLLLTGEPHLTLTTNGVQPTGATTHRVLSTSAAAPVEWIFLILAVAALAVAGWLWSSRGRSQPPAAAA